MTSAASLSLLYAVRPRVVARRTGQMAVLLAGLTTVPLTVSLSSGDGAAAWRYGAVLIALALAGLWLSRLEAPSSIQTNEALVISALTFSLTPLAMAYPMMAAGIDFGDALFECISAITTTGLSTLGGLDGRPLSFLFERAWMQWIGGLGIVVLSVALLAGDDVAARRLVESPLSQETLDTSARQHAQRSLVTYALLTVLSVAGLWLAGWSGFDAVVLALGAISTGGFAPHDASLAASPLWTARLAVIGVALLGAVSLPLYRAAWRRRWTALAEDPELRLLAATCVLGSGLLMLLMARAQGGWSPDLAAHAVAMAVSAQTTSGFATLPPALLDPAALLTLMTAMAIGGSVGSTAGGVKLLRLLLVLRLAQWVVRRTAMPSRAVAVVRVHDQPVDGDALSRALLLVLLFGATVLLSWLPFLLMGHPPMAALFEVVSAVATAGLSTGLTGPGLDPLLKGVLCIDMLLGRLEFIAVLVMLYPRTWRANRRSA